MTDEPEPTPFLPLPVLGRSPVAADPGSGAAPPGPIDVVYVSYRDPQPLEFPGTAGLLPGPVFHAAGVLLREDDAFLALGEVAFARENAPYVGKYGADLFPAYRHVLTIPKACVLERRTIRLDPQTGRRSEKGGTGGGPIVGTSPE